MLFARYAFDWSLLSVCLKHFKLFEIIFVFVRFYGSVFRVLSDMYDISDVPESEEDRGKVCYDIPTVSNYEKVPESFAYPTVQKAVNYARTTEPVAVDIFFDIGAVVYAVLVA